MTVVNLDDGKEIVLEESTQEVKHSGVSHEVRSFMVDWLVNNKYAKSEKQAKFLLISVSLFCLSLSVVFFFYASNYVFVEGDLAPLQNK